MSEFKITGQQRIAGLTKDHRGYPVPWFVQWIDGKPCFPLMDADKYFRAIKERLCWVCGEPLGAWLVFVAGPMCGINRTSSEPPSHKDCALFSVQNCPFLVNPKMKRIENENTKDGKPMAGVMIRRNPGTSILWYTKSYKVIRDVDGRPLIKMGPAERIEAWSQGRDATEEELRNSILTGLPELEKMITNEIEARQLKKAIADFELVLKLKWKRSGEV